VVGFVTAVAKDSVDVDRSSVTSMTNFDPLVPLRLGVIVETVAGYRNIVAHDA
jgi:hypothetical protein